MIPELKILNEHEKRQILDKLKGLALAAQIRRISPQSPDAVVAGIAVQPSSEPKVQNTLDIGLAFHCPSL